MAGTINPRWLRKGRVVYTDDSSFAILIDSPAPGQWHVATAGGSLLLRRSSFLAGAYSRLLTSVSMIKHSDDSFEALQKIHAALGTASGSTYGAEAAPLQRRIKKMLDVRSPTGAAPSPFKSFREKLTEMADEAYPRDPLLTEGGAIKDAIAAATSSEPVSRASGKFEVRPYDPDSFWYESDEDSSLYRDFIELRKNHHPVNLLIAGPSGSGKTEGIIRLGKELEIPVHIINCQAITTPEKWLGQMHADMETGTRFVPSQHIEWVERTHEDCEGFDTCIILYDEITRLRPELNNMTYSLFDTQRGLEVPQMGRRVMMSQENMIVATANIGSAFTGTHTQDRAFRERFAITMERSFPPSDAEVRILESSTDISIGQAKELVTVANNTRTMWGNDEIESPISTRTLKAWALLCAGGYSVKKAAEYTVIPLYSNDGGLASDRTKVASLIEGKVR